MREESLEAEVARLRTDLWELKARIDPAATTIAENSPDIILLLDREGRIQYINRTVPDLTVEEVVGVSVFEFMAEEFHAPVRACFEGVLTTRKPGRYETSYDAADCEKSWWESSVGAVVRDDQVVGLAVITTNVSEARHATEERERFFNLSMDMLCIAGFDGYFKRVNPAFVDALGYSSEELLGRPFEEFIHPDDVERTRETEERLRRGGVLIDFENRYRRSDGEYRLLSWRASPDAKGGLITAVARDVTERKSLEEQLRQAQKMEAVGQLTGGIAHDFNNLLMAITGNLDLLLDMDSESDRRATLDELFAVSARASDLTSQLLAFSRKQVLMPSVVDLVGLTRKFRTLLMRTLGESIAVELHCESERLTGHVDPGQLENALLNLCLNARDAMPRGGTLSIILSEVKVSEARANGFELQAGQYVRMRIADTGEGMPVSVRQRVFEPFFTTKPLGRGCGLGLSMVYGFVKQSAGHIEVASSPGQGSTFDIYLPRGHVPAPAAETNAHSEGPVGGGQRVLVVEDEKSVRQVAARTMTAMGYLVYEAEDCAAAVDILEQSSDVALVLTDIGLPGGRSGIDLAADVVRRWPAVRVILTSGYADNEKLAGVLSGVAFLPKPYRAAELAQALAAALGDHAIAPG